MVMSARRLQKAITAARELDRLTEALNLYLAGTPGEILAALETQRQALKPYPSPLALTRSSTHA